MTVHAGRRRTILTCSDYRALSVWWIWPRTHSELISRPGYPHTEGGGQFSCRATSWQHSSDTGGHLMQDSARLLNQRFPNMDLLYSFESRLQEIKTEVNDLSDMLQLQREYN